MNLISAVWQKLVWCGLIGGIVGLAICVNGLLRPVSGQASQSPITDLVCETLLGTLYGLVLLGTPAVLWVLGEWVLRGRAAATTSEAGRAAAAGSAAAIPLALLGAAAGLLICLTAVSIFTLTPWVESLAKPAFRNWYITATLVGGAAGFLTGTFLGSAIGALVGGIHALLRRGPG